MEPSRRRELLARLALSALALLPFLPLLGFDRIPVPDDFFVSDLYNGELPVRGLVGQLVAKGEAPVWSSQLCSGGPLVGIGEPVGLLTFGLLPPTAALDLLLVVLLLVAAHGAYGLARRLGADVFGALLAGAAFSGSGYLVCQVRHLNVLSTVVWLPWGLLLLDWALAARSPEPVDGAPSAEDLSFTGRVTALGLFGLVFGEQAISGFPQCVYISALVYGAWAVALLVGQVRAGSPWRVVSALGGLFLAASGLGSLVGSVALLPMSELAGLSYRSQDLDWRFAAMSPYAWSDLLNFALPYVNGDAADDSYQGSSVFWETYGYAGLAALLLGCWAMARGWRRPRVVLLAGISLVALVLVLGPNTPVYRLAWEYLPGMGRFRLPTRFLFVVELGIALLGGLGLSLLRRELASRVSEGAPRLALWVAVGVVLGNSLDLLVQQPRQNPLVSGSEWLTPPPTVSLLAAQGPGIRIYSPWHDQFHRLVHQQARGWQDLGPYHALRESLAPNLGAYWGVPTADCYEGITPRWHFALWGDHLRKGAVSQLSGMDEGRLVGAPQLGTFLGTFGVTHVLSPLPVLHPSLRLVGQTGSAFVYSLPGKRARVVPQARFFGTDDDEVLGELFAPGFDPDAVVLLQGVPPGLPGLPAAIAEPRSPVPAQAGVVAETSRRLELEVVAPEGGYLVVADTWYPGWRAEVDGVSAPMLRANVGGRAVPLSRGSRRVVLFYDAPSFFLGLWLTLGGVAGLVAWVGLGWARRSR